MMALWVLCLLGSLSMFLFVQSFLMSPVMMRCYRSSLIVRSTFSSDQNTEYQQEQDFPDLLSEDSALYQLIVRFNCDEIDPEEISELVHELGTSSVSIEVDTEKSDVLNDEKKWSDLVKIQSWATSILKATIPASFDRDALVAMLTDMYGDLLLDISVQSMQPKDWVTHVQEMWQPQPVGASVICFPWHDMEALRHQYPDKQPLVLEGGIAFGTGDHPTTRLCMQWLQKHLKGSSGKTVLDYGCGSAILALTALQCGAMKADGVDIDKDALQSARRNADRNNLATNFYMVDDSSSTTSGIVSNELDDARGVASADEISTITMNTWRGKLGEDIQSVSVIENESYDLVAANILAPILINLAPTLARHTAKGGRIALSGVMLPQAEVVIRSYQPYFTNVQVEAVEDDWVIITGDK